MSAPWSGWPTRAPSPDFAARVAAAARRRHVARRMRRIGAGVSVIALAAAAAVFVRAQTHVTPPASDPGSRAAIRPDVPRIPPGSVTWPVGDGWTEEVFDFPLSFAPDVPYAGTVPIHFSATFTKPGTPAYWSYVPIWIKAGVPANEAHDPRQLERDLRGYYTGLCGTGGHPVNHTLSPGFTGEARLEEAPLDPRDAAMGGAWSLKGTLQAVDCIVTGDQLALNVEAVIGACSDRTSFTAYILSPRPAADPIWDALRAERRAFDCRRVPTADAIAARVAIPAVPIPDTPAGHALAFLLAGIARAPAEGDIAARFTPEFLADSPAHEIADYLERQRGGFSPARVVRLIDATPLELTAVIVSGDRLAPIVGRERVLRIAIDPRDPTRIASLHELSPGAVDASEAGAH